MDGTVGTAIDQDKRKGPRPAKQGANGDARRHVAAALLKTMQIDLDARTKERRDGYPCKRKDPLACRPPSQQQDQDRCAKNQIGYRPEHKGENRDQGGRAEDRYQNQREHERVQIDARRGGHGLPSYRSLGVWPKTQRCAAAQGSAPPLG